MTRPTRRRRATFLAASSASIALCTSLAAPAAPPEDEASFEVRVDPRVELVSSVFRLAGHREFNMDVARSAYTEAFDERFAPFADHPAVEHARRLRSERSISYDAPATLAVHLTDLETLGERVPFDLPPARLDPRWDAVSARAFVADLRRFSQDSDFSQWFESNAKLRATVEGRLRAFLEPRLHADWFPKFFGGAPKARCIVVPSLLQGGQNYGCSVRFEDGSEEITPCIGLWSFDDEGLPVFDDLALGIVAHELAHAWVNPLVAAHAESFDPPGERLFPAVRGSIRNRSYATWRIVTCELLVRATVVRWRLAHEGRDAARRQAEADRDEGFAWVAELGARLSAYEDDRDTYGTFEEFVPVLAAVFASLAERVPVAEAPRVVSVWPEDGATDVEAGEAVLRVEFDRPMGPAISMMLLRGVEFPRVVGTPGWDAAGKVVTVAVEMVGGKEYGYSLNSEGAGGFRSRDGVRLEPVEVRFRTKR